ncbi:MAG: Sulfotransferase domain [Rhodobacteraceae bacterium HLUCCA12]|nr:MAG: Sulfotransferase domain [Rhodobacteraceae bacterium HLUCCA12]
MHEAVTTRPVWPEGVRLLLGIGAQKAGTSWVHHNLRAHPACRPGPMKELHYFDYVAGNKRTGRVLRNRKSHLLAVMGRKDRIAGVQRLSEICEAPDDNHQSYVDLMTDGLRPGQVAIDITPSYMTLKAEHFQTMAGLGDTRFLLLLREPVARLWSAIRMRMAKKIDDETQFEAACQELLDRIIDEGDGREIAKGDYAKALSRLKRAVPDERLLVLFFEDLFCQQSLDRICAFLEIAPHPMRAQEPVNAGQRARMRPDQEHALAALLRPQYDAVRAAFGSTVPQAWHARFAEPAPKVMT